MKRRAIDLFVSVASGFYLLGVFLVGFLARIW